MSKPKASYNVINKVYKITEEQKHRIIKSMNDIIYYVENTRLDSNEVSSLEESIKILEDLK